MFVPWLASSEVLGDRESDPERRDVRREPAFSKAFVCKVSGSLFAPTQALWLDRAPLAHGRIVHQEVGASYGGLRLSFAASALAKAGLLRGVRPAAGSRPLVRKLGARVALTRCTEDLLRL